ncbi:MAG: hypothetical protein PHS48_05480 [Bacteroidales bacterium]|nr:hypothetical protein [Bacteroidales bacterium]
MKTNYLFPHRFKRIGWILLIPSTILGILVICFDVKFDFLSTKMISLYNDSLLNSEGFFKVFKENITDEIAGIVFIIGALFVAFSREKQEDEFIAKTRLESLVWATYLNYAVLLFCFLFFYGGVFFYVMIINMFTILIFFIIRFYYILYKNKRTLGIEASHQD